VELLYVFRNDSGEGLRAHPWPESSARRLAAIAALDHTTPSTKLIPQAIVTSLFQGAMAIIERADSILGRRLPAKSLTCDRDRILLRSACYVVLALTSGCRNHELASIEKGAIRRTTHEGEVFYWLRGHSLKTHRGVTEWLMPEIASQCVQIMERWSDPFRQEIGQQLAAIRLKLASTPNDTASHVVLLREQQRLSAARGRLFLGKSGRCSWVEINRSVIMRALVIRIGDLLAARLRIWGPVGVPE
jgi:hypothetical protein